MRYLSKGKRGIVCTTQEKGVVVAVKMEREGSKAVRALENEAFWLQKLNAHGIGPKFIRFRDRALVMEYIEGQPFVEWYEQHSKKQRKGMITKIFRQCRILDALRVNKLEMHHPVKHIIIRKNEPIMIDFERCKRTLKPKNVTQFCQFLLSLGEKADAEKLRTLLMKYKKNYDENDFEKIIRLFVS